ncbi:hypothetical protein N7541_010171 [Penicillium brevicompactum]|uniref:PPPDE domain-containing protein n=1 Tax=Penicillium brevicompactum TaxID=5074 RepID=A0A9W9UHD0_PENBR|nr:hypothetical protein N7541_010171 [Penicillium brevicompactum]
MVSQRDILIAKIFAGVVSLLVSSFLIFKLVRARSRRKAKEASRKLPPKKIPGKQAPQKRGPLSKVPGRRASSAEIKKWYRGAIDKIVTARLQRECSTTSGEPVFLSHYISQGQFRHWVLHVYGHKYELRQVANSDSDSQKSYEAVIAPSGFNLEEYRRSVTVHYSPEVGNYFYSMIGWTKLSKEEVDHKCRRVSGNFGGYALLTNNCHDFLQRLANLIVTTKAPDWKWFRRHAVGGYQYMEQPPLGYGVISAVTWSKQLEETKHYLGTDEQKKINDFIIVLDHQVESDLKRTIGFVIIGTAAPTIVYDKVVGDGQDDIGEIDGNGNHDSGGGDGGNVGWAC